MFIATPNVTPNKRTTENIEKRKKKEIKMEHYTHTTRRSSIYKKANSERVKDENRRHTENK